MELELRLRLGLRLGWDERDVGEWFVVNVAGCFGVVEILFLFWRGSCGRNGRLIKLVFGSALQPLQMHVLYIYCKESTFNYVTLIDLCECRCFSLIAEVYSRRPQTRLHLCSAMLTTATSAQPRPPS